MTNKPSEQLLAAFQKYLNLNLGLNYSSMRERELLRKISGISREFGMDNPSECISWLIDTPVNRAIAEKLAIHCSIGETFFFREPKSFEYLEKIHLPALIRERSSKGKYLRIWSAGVASGEEIYSIAILLRQFIPNPKTWNISLLATDISPVLMDKAMHGIYSKWSFRHNKYSVDSYFSPAGENRFQLSDTIREMVRFSWLNLAEPVYPSAATNTLDIDIIFCRNVMIYFSGDVIGAVTDRFYQCLVKGGILVVSPADMTPYISNRFHRVVYSGYTIYQKGTEKKRAQVEPENPPGIIPAVNYSPDFKIPEASLSDMLLFPVPSLTTFNENPPQGNQDQIPISLEEAQKLFDEGSFSVLETRLENQKPDHSEAKFLLAKTKANIGKHHESAELCNELLSKRKSDYRIHYLYATILSETGNMEEAIASLNKVIYLEKDFIPGHYLLGNLIRKHKGKAMAEKHFHHLQKILSKMNPEAIIPESGGLTTAKFTELVKSNL